ncbi:MAG: DNA cytosine methyltransferase [Calditrichaeota bacterium]|nr:DNA cytosine methyltransferase [Calditrichota bacterium]MBT7790350.1 DNA cytosine methyltransferase [Calditrichota bacterium]
MKPIPIIDIFAGPGGLSEGFGAVNGQLKVSPFKIALSIENDFYSWQTLSLRHFFRQFQTNNYAIPQEYYLHLAEKLGRDELFKKFPKAAKEALNASWQTTLGEVDEEELDLRIQRAVGESKNWILIGGPPCQAYSLAGRSRNMGIKDYVPEKDKRHFLYREYLRILAKHQPPIFVMENVKGLLSSKLNGENLFEKVLADLKNPHNGNLTLPHCGHRYKLFSLVVNNFNPSPESLVVRSEKYGIPQKRHRVIIIGIRDDIDAQPGTLDECIEHVPIKHVISGLPKIRSRISGRIDNQSEWTKNLLNVKKFRWFKELDSDLKDKINETLESQKAYNYEISKTSSYRKPDKYDDWFIDRGLIEVPNHDSRSHMKSDLHRYLFVSTFGAVRGFSPKLSDFPKSLLPAHKNAVASALSGKTFVDRFRVQRYDQPATTITCHISKDGHYYIHPDPAQCRSLTVREAARVQTFPDNYFFCGPRTSQYIQVGNAVPPLLARQIAEIVWDVLKELDL